MKQLVTTTIDKAYKINKQSSIYGSFAEIGAGQETVHYFFKAGLASQTIAKSMSAYDMTFSDAIYGKQNRYVCRDRLITMLNHEYKLLEKRLKNKRGDQTRFFAFATTAATRSQKRHAGSGHAWMGLRFQDEAKSQFNDVVFYINCLDKNRLQQHEALGILGVNLIHACFHYKNQKKFINSFLDNLQPSRVEIDDIRLLGPIFNENSSATMNKLLLEKNLTRAVFFDSSQKSQFVGDAIFNKPIVLVCGDKKFIQQIQKQKIKLLKIFSKSSFFISTILEKHFRKTSDLDKKSLSVFCKNKFNLLITKQIDLIFLKKLIDSYGGEQSFILIVSESHFKKEILSLKNKPLLKKTEPNKVGLFSKNNTKIIVVPESSSKKFSFWVINLKQKPATI